MIIFKTEIRFVFNSMVWVMSFQYKFVLMKQNITSAANIGEIYCSVELSTRRIICDDAFIYRLFPDA